MKKSLLKLTLAAATLTALATTASAAPTPGYGNVAVPIYFGSGNVNGNFTTVTDDVLGIQAGLRVKNRGTLATVDGSSGMYSVPQGLCNPACSGGPKQFLSYEFSLDSRYGQVGGDLSNYFVTVSVDNNPTAMTNFTVLDMFNNWNDNEYSPDNGVTKHKSKAPTASASGVAGDTAVQQSANASFGDAGFAGMVLADGLYTIRLDVYLKNTDGGMGELVLSDSIIAKVGDTVPVPEPASLALAAIALVGVGASRCKAKKTIASPAMIAT